MSTAETTTPAERIKQIHARLHEIAPYPETGEVAAGDLARWLTVRAQVIFRQQITPGAKTDRGDIDLMTILYAAAHARAALDNDNPAYGAETATEIRDAWATGDIGEWIWAYLGDDEIPAEIGDLAEELLTLQPSAEERTADEHH